MGSPGGEEVKLDERKRKRMESNRESARRSRMRKQQHLDDLTAQITLLKKQNSGLKTVMNTATQDYLKMEAENSALRAQVDELGSRLQSLDEIVNVLDHANSLGGEGTLIQVNNDFVGAVADLFMIGPWRSPYLSQPIMANDDMFQYKSSLLV